MLLLDCQDRNSHLRNVSLAQAAILGGYKGLFVICELICTVFLPEAFHFKLLERHGLAASVLEAFVGHIDHLVVQTLVNVAREP